MKSFPSTILTILSIALCGCGGASDGPQMAPVTGTVTIDGQPATSGQVYFYPDSQKGTTGPMAMGTIGENGQYSIKSAGEREGAVIGAHQVRIEIRQPPKDERDTQPPLMIAEKYNNQNTSELTAEVEPETKNVFDFDLQGP